jgi:hypothetical protein
LRFAAGIVLLGSPLAGVQYALHAWASPIWNALATAAS